MKSKLLKKIRKEIYVYYDQLDRKYVLADYTRPVAFVGYNRWFFKKESDAVEKLYEIRIENARKIMYEDSTWFTYVRNRSYRLKY